MNGEVPAVAGVRRVGCRRPLSLSVPRRCLGQPCRLPAKRGLACCGESARKRPAKILLHYMHVPGSHLVQSGHRALSPGFPSPSSHDPPLQADCSAHAAGPLRQPMRGVPRGGPLAGWVCRGAVGVDPAVTVTGQGEEHRRPVALPVRRGVHPAGGTRGDLAGGQRGGVLAAPRGPGSAGVLPAAAAVAGGNLAADPGTGDLGIELADQLVIAGGVLPAPAAVSRRS